MRIRYIGAAFATSILAMLPLGGARAQPGFLNEVRLGGYQHDTGLIGTNKEAGADFSLEVLSRPIIPLKILGAPRLVVGGLANSSGQSNQLYAGFVGRFDLAHSLFANGDGFFLEGTLGGDWNDGKKDVRGTALAANWKSHGSALMFRIGFGLGYQFNSTWSAVASFNHISNAGLGPPNEGMNDLGLIIGMKL
jgi:lipid A 3-O-deacylase